MSDDERDFHRVPGLYRIWDLHLVIGTDHDHRVTYTQLADDGTPLFSVYRRHLDNHVATMGKLS